MFKKIFISFLLLAFALGLFAQNDKNKEDGARQALFIYNFSKYIEWSNFNSLKEFKIGVIG
ncbi:MAG: YfiR family protein, partial [Flavobacteriales bacterium]|nr:YfiR family protein [Flavobacteriales bacterium]